MKPRPYQKGGIHLPPEFAALLRALRRTGDYRLPPTMAAAHAAGWTYRILAEEIGLTTERARQIAGEESGHEALPVPALPALEPSPRPKRPPTADLTPAQVDELRALAAGEDRAALRAAVHGHWARGVPRTRLAEVLDTRDWAVGNYITEHQKIAEQEEFGRPLSPGEAASASQAEERFLAESKAWMAKERARIKAEEKARAKKKAVEAQTVRDPALLIATRTKTLAVKNLRALEDYPGEGELWWVQCKICKRVWRMPEERLRACPHKGAGDPGHPPLPEPVRRRSPRR